MTNVQPELPASFMRLPVSKHVYKRYYNTAVKLTHEEEEKKDQDA